MALARRGLTPRVSQAPRQLGRHCVMYSGLGASHRTTGRLTPLQVLRSTPPEFTGYSTGAEIWVDRAGRNVYLSNRGHDSIGVFGIDAANGTLAPRQWVPTKGSVPRFFCFDPTGRFLYVANQGGHTIIGYRVGRDGKLSPTPIRLKVASPACIVFSGADS